jgi:DNA polymerase-3 subunit gamma/tau
VKALQSRLERLESGAPRPVPASHDPQQPQTAAGRTAVAVAAVPAERPAPEAAVEESPAAVAAVAVVDGELTLEALAEQWPAVLESLRAESPMVAAALEDARPAALAGEGLTLIWPQSAVLSKRKAEDPATRELIARAVRAVTGTSLRLAYEVSADAEPAVQATLSEEELVERLVQEFDAQEES